MLIDDGSDQTDAELIGQRASTGGITEDPIVAPDWISFKQYVLF
jgi:hypothetical protein